MLDDRLARLGSMIHALQTVLQEVGPDLSPPALRGEIAAPPTRSVLPVLETLGAVLAHAPATARPFVAELVALAPTLAWRQTYKPGEAAPGFLRGYGWTELAGAKCLVRDASVSAGLLLLGPEVVYPSHQHAALEHYLPLSGHAEWYDEDLGWRRVPPLTRILHRPWIRHAMRTADEPLLAYFLWTGPGVGERARFSAGPP
jgi:hypothetical protein